MSKIETINNVEHIGPWWTAFVYFLKAETQQKRSNWRVVPFAKQIFGVISCSDHILFGGDVVSVGNEGPYKKRSKFFSVLHKYGGN